MIVWVKLFMSAATACFFAGYLVRWRNNPLHRKLMIAGFLLTVGIAVVMVVGIQGFGATYRPAAWLLDLTGGLSGATRVMVAHRIFATGTLLLLVAQIVSGLRRHPLHNRLFKPVIVCWLLTYGSGMVVFMDGSP